MQNKTYREGYPRSIQEVMSIGRVVVTTNSVGCKEGVNGFLIPPYDYKFLANKMEYFIQNPNEINKMGLESRRIAEQNFDIHKINKRLINLIVN